MKRWWISCRHALNGGAFLLRSQRHARIHFVFTLVALALAGWLGLTRMEWLILIGITAAVWTAEALNTAIEQIADEVSLERRPRIRAAKDVAAFGVLVAAVAAAGIGLLLFGPKLLERLGLA